MSDLVKFRDVYNKLPKERRDKIDRQVEKDLRDFRSIDMAVEEWEWEEVEPDEE